MPEKLYTNVFCPQCGNEVVVTVGGRADRLMNAIELQARRMGVEFECGDCNCIFIYRVRNRSMPQLEHSAQGHSERRRVAPTAARASGADRELVTVN